MNTPTITRAKNCTKLLLLALIAFAPVSAPAEWKIDLSRRQKAVRDQEIRNERGPSQASEEKTFFDTLFESGEPVQEVVVLNTDKGFLPSTLRMRKGGKYLVHVVNVNEKEKNISFVLDGFSEHHATFYGKVKSFRLEPKKEGVFSFQCPETSIEGRLVVHTPKGSESAPAAAIRAPSSEEK